MRQPTNDPRKPGGAVAGMGGSKVRNSMVVDTRSAVLMDDVTVLEVEAQRRGLPGQRVLAMTLEGRINKTEDRSAILYLFDADGAAALITELLALASRMGPTFEQYLYQRIDALKSGGHTGPGEGSL